MDSAGISSQFAESEISANIDERATRSDQSCNEKLGVNMKLKTIILSLGLLSATGAVAAPVQWAGKGLGL